MIDLMAANKVFTFPRMLEALCKIFCFVFAHTGIPGKHREGSMIVAIRFQINLVKVWALQFYHMLFIVPEKFMSPYLYLHKVLYASEVSIFSVNHSFVFLELARIIF